MTSTDVAVIEFYSEDIRSGRDGWFFSIREPSELSGTGADRREVHATLGEAFDAAEKWAKGRGLILATLGLSVTARRKVED